jgi:hypothetical protein
MSGRIRTVKPEWLEDELMAQASDAAARLSVGLILLADDYGRGRASLAFLASSVWGQAMERNDGADAPEVLRKASGALRELVEMRFVTLYEVDRQRYFAVRNWDKHQKVSHKGLPRVPEPPPPAKPNDNAKGGASPEALAKPSGVSHESLVPDPDLRSGSPITTTIATPARAPESAMSRTRKAEQVRVAVVAAFDSRSIAKPRECADLDGGIWHSLSERLEQPDLAAHGVPLDVLATMLAALFDDQRAKAQGYPVSWILARPAQYLSARVEPEADLAAIAAGIPRAITSDDDSDEMILQPRRRRA